MRSSSPFGAKVWGKLASNQATMRSAHATGMSTVPPQIAVDAKNGAPRSKAALIDSGFFMVKHPMTASGLATAIRSSEV